MSENNGGDAILALLLGGVIGVGLGLFYATQSGSESKKKVKIFFDDIGEKTGELIEEGRETFAELVHPPKTTSKK
jgi:gas vesicle protein